MGLKENEKKDTKKYLYELALRAVREEKKIKELPVLDYYGARSEYFVRLERRNEALNKAVVVLNEELGICVSKLRIHQRNARYIYAAIAGVFAFAETEQTAAVL